MLKARLLSPGLPPWQCTDKGRPILRSSCSRWSQPRCRSLCCKWPGQSLQGRPPRPSWWDLVASCPVVALLTVAWPLQSQCLLLHPLMRWESSHYWNFQSRPRTVSLPSNLLSLHTFTFPSHFHFFNPQYDENTATRCPCSSLRAATPQRQPPRQHQARSQRHARPPTTHQYRRNRRHFIVACPPHRFKSRLVIHNAYVYKSIHKSILNSI